MTDVACQNELVLRERRGELSGSERTLLDAHLGSCEACRFSRQLGRAFDEAATLERGDGERIAVLAELGRRFAASSAGALPPTPPSLLGASNRSAPRARLPRAVLLAAALPLFVAAAASAAFGVYRAQTEAARLPAPLPLQTPDSAPVRSPRAPRAVATALEAPPAPAPLPEPARAVTPEPPRRERAPSPPAASAAERFELANAARRGGDITRAITLYRELERDFPASAEAASAELRLGSLLLERGKAGAALEQFERHLRRGGALVPEALYGRGRALAALDEAGAERQTWTRLLREFSSSPYAAHARRRLEALGLGVSAPN